MNPTNAPPITWAPSRLSHCYMFKRTNSMDPQDHQPLHLGELLEESDGTTHARQIQKNKAKGTKKTQKAV